MATFLSAKRWIVIGTAIALAGLAVALTMWVSKRTDSWFVSGAIMAHPRYFEELRRASPESLEFDRGPSFGHRVAQGEGVVLGYSTFEAGGLLTPHDARYVMLTAWLPNGLSSGGETMELGQDAFASLSAGNPAYPWDACYEYLDTGTLDYVVEGNGIRLELDVAPSCSNASLPDTLHFNRVPIDRFDACDERGNFEAPHHRPCREDAPASAR